MRRWLREAQSSRTKVTARLTLNSVILPSSIITFWSLTQALLIPRNVSEARSMPCLVASSKLLGDVAEISVTRAIDMVSSFRVQISAQHTDERHVPESAQRRRAGSLAAGNTANYRSSQGSEINLDRQPAFDG